MQPPALQRLSSHQSLFDWRQLLRFLLLGPITGAVVGFAQTTMIVLCWVIHGEPDFYFRGWQGVELNYLAMIMGGGIVGIPYGGVLWIVERFTFRRIRPFIAIPLVVVLASGIAGAIAAVEFQRQYLGWAFAPALSAPALGLLVSIATSRRAQ